MWHRGVSHVSGLCPEVHSYGGSIRASSSTNEGAEIHWKSQYAKQKSTCIQSDKDSECIVKSVKCIAKSCKILNVQKYIGEVWNTREKQKCVRQNGEGPMQKCTLENTKYMYIGQNKKQIGELVDPMTSCIDPAVAVFTSADPELVKCRAPGSVACMAGPCHPKSIRSSSHRPTARAVKICHVVWRTVLVSAVGDFSCFAWDLRHTPGWVLSKGTRWYKAWATLFLV